MDFVRAWKQNGVVLRLLVAEKRGESSWRFVFRTNTPEPETPSASLGFPRKARITRGLELQRIAREGKRIRTVHLEVRAAASPCARLSNEWEGVRIGLVVPRFKHSAVARNRLKRRLRELARMQLLPAKLPLDIVLLIRPEAYNASFEGLSTDILRALEQLKQWHVLINMPSAGTDLTASQSDGTE